MTGEWRHVYRTSAVSICITIPSLPPAAFAHVKIYIYIFIYIYMKLYIDTYVHRGFKIQ